MGSLQGTRVIVETFKADPGPAVEAQVAADMAKRMLPVLPVLVLVAGLIWGPDGAASGARYGARQRAASQLAATAGFPVDCALIHKRRLKGTGGTA